ncbi:hypothetical protein PR048_011977 [Dryococelus australis]|uniref:Uncharacterized protein n=1 Tax=Dryococelus australis TaxID=614101 RepID=A0ABQ9HN71_9NEOP|nr:hypothetical protein PR048_011977 [Dryococelus australis]
MYPSNIEETFGAECILLKSFLLEETCYKLFSRKVFFSTCKSLKLCAFITNSTTRGTTLCACN